MVRVEEKGGVEGDEVKRMNALNTRGGHVLVYVFRSAKISRLLFLGTKYHQVLALLFTQNFVCVFLCMKTIHVHES